MTPGDAFKVSPIAEFGVFGHEICQLPPSAGDVVQHHGQPVQDLFAQSANTHV